MPRWAACRCTPWCRVFPARQATSARRRRDRRTAQQEGDMSDATDRTLPVWRSALYVPSNVPKFIDGAYKRGADAIIVDLEDSVPLAERPVARRDLLAT